MNAALPASNVSRPWSSWSVDNDGSARPDLATSRMVCAATTAGLPRIGVPLALTTWPPADASRLLNQTV